MSVELNYIYKVLLIFQHQQMKRTIRRFYRFRLDRSKTEEMIRDGSVD
jgi:hypothetical protein